MTKYEELLNKDRLVSFITMLNKGHTICGLCYADRKVCRAEINNNCVRQYLDKDRDSDFYCIYKKV